MLKKLLLGAAVASIALANAAFAKHDPYAADVASIIFFIAGEGEGDAPGPSFRARYSSATNQANYSFPTCDLGDPHSTRVNVVCVRVHDIAVSAMDVAGTTAVVAGNIDTAGARCSIWRASTGSSGGSSGTISMTNASGERCTIAVYTIYPSSASEMGSCQDASAGTSIIANNLLGKTTNGFTIGMVVGDGSTNNTTCTHNGTETITENDDHNVEGTSTMAVYSFVNTETNATRDFTGAKTGAGFMGILFVTWL